MARGCRVAPMLTIVVGFLLTADRANTDVVVLLDRGDAEIPQPENPRLRFGRPGLHV